MIFICKASGQQWYALPDPLDGHVYSILPDTNNNILYVGGGFGGTGSTINSNIAGWNGSNWSSIGTGMDFWTGSIFCLEFYNNNLIAVGDFTDYNSIAKWDGLSWSGFGNGFYSSTLMAFGNTTVTKIKNFNNKLYFTGAFRYILPFPLTDTVNSICYWDGTQFQKYENTVGSWIGLSFNNTISGFAGFSMTVHNNQLYLGGQLDSIAGNPIPSYIAKLDTSGWSNVGQSIPPLGFPYSLFSYNGELFAGGQGPTGNLHKLLGNTWVPIGQFVGNAIINAMCIYKGDLVVAGRFDSVDNVPANGIARWNGLNWSSFGSGIDGEVWCLDVFQGDLYAGGNFVTAGGVYAPYIARWSEPLGVLEEKKYRIDCYPNPVINNLNILALECDNGEYLITISNTFNHPVISQRITAQNNQLRTSFDLENLAPGLYFLKISSSKAESKVIKVVKN